MFHEEKEKEIFNIHSYRFQSYKHFFDEIGAKPKSNTSGFLLTGYWAVVVCRESLPEQWESKPAGSRGLADEPQIPVRPSDIKPFESRPCSRADMRFW